MTSRRNTARRRLSAEEREREILEGAVTFFSQNGLRADTRALADQLGVSHGLIFRYFPTKGELLDRLFDRITLVDRHPAWEAILKDSSQPLRRRLTAFYTSFLSEAEGPEWLRLIMHSSLADGDVTLRYYEDHFKGLIDIIVIEMRKTRRDGEFDRPVTPDEREAVLQLHGVIYYYLIRRHITRIVREKPSAEWLARVIDRFFDGMAPGVGR